MLDELNETRIDLRLGRIGMAEATALTAISLCVNGLFGMDREGAYSKGNLTYITIPLSVAASFLCFLFVCSVMKKRGCGDLWELLEGAFGRTFAAVMGMIICVCILYSSDVPMHNFGQALENLVYEGVEFPKLILFMLPVPALIAFRGLETAGRTAKCYALLLLVSLFIALISSSPSWKSYRLYPISTGCMTEALTFSLTDSVCFIPVFAALLAVGRGVHGAYHTQKAGSKAALIAVTICFAVQLMLGGLYTYDFLAKTDMPLCRVNYLSIERNYLMWLDKVLLMIWLNGCMISAAFSIYASAFLFARAWGQRDIRPACIAFAAISGFCVMTEYVPGGKTAGAMMKMLSRYGALLSSVPLILAAVVCAVKGITKGRRSWRSIPQE